MLTAYTELKNKGFNVKSLGLFEGDDGEIEDGDFVVTGIPTTRDLLTVNCPLTKRYIWLEDVDATDKNCTFVTAGYNFKNHKTVDLLTLDDFCILNAVPTAEGAIAFAIQNTDFTLWKSKVLVIGNGRLGKILSERLNALKCYVTVSARKSADFALINAYNSKSINTSDIIDDIEKEDIVFNTIDVTFDCNVADKCRGKLILDLSTLGCFTKEQIENYSIKYFKLPGLPGKTAPETAGKIIADTVERIIV